MASACAAQILADAVHGNSICEQAVGKWGNVLQFFQTAHHPKRRYRGRVPRVHQGFQESWVASGIRDRVLAHVSALLDSAEDRSAVQVRHILLGMLPSDVMCPHARHLQLM